MTVYDPLCECKKEKESKKEKWKFVGTKLIFRILIILNITNKVCYLNIFYGEIYAISIYVYILQNIIVEKNRILTEFNAFLGIYLWKLRIFSFMYDG